MTNETAVVAEQTIATATVTIDDVRHALATAGGETPLDPRKTNAAAMRKVIGRGGMGTIQKHLDSLRTELDKPIAVMDGEIPAPPRETLDAIWRSAWTQAQAHTSAALATAMLERDQARSALETARADVETLTASEEAAEAATVDAVTKAAEAAATAEASRIALEQSIAKGAADAASAADSAAKASTDAANAIAALQAQHDLAISHAETRIVTLQGVIDRMTEQLAEVKSLLPRVQQ